jgi:hypothetical protein
MEKEGVVSIWILHNVYGDLSTAMRMCGVPFYDLDLVECAGNEDGSTVDVSELISRLSYSSHFAQDAVAQARKLGISNGRRAIAYYDFEFEPAAGDSSAVGDPTFLGAFSFKA